MAGQRTGWSTDPPPVKLRRRYPADLAAALTRRFAAETLEWRTSGSGHFEVRPKGGGKTITLTFGRSADAPAYAAKIRTALRQWD